MVEAMVRMSKAMEDEAARRQRVNGGRLKGVPVSLSSIGVGGIAPQQSWSVTDLGELVLERYREAGADLPEGWAPGKAAASGTS